MSYCVHFVVAKADLAVEELLTPPSPFEKYCVQETHYVKPPFIPVFVIPENFLNCLTNILNGFNSV